MTKAAGQVTEIWRFPIKSMGGERVAQAELTAAGLLGDRALALLDIETGKVASAKTVRLFPDLMACQARFEKEPVPGDPIIDHLPNLNPAGNRDIVLPQPLGASLFRALGQEPPLTPNALQDLFPLSVMTSGTLSALRDAAQGSTVRTERFRMNVVIEASVEGMPENHWAGLRGSLGEAVLAFAMPAPRCVMTTRPTAGLEEDTRILRAISEINRIELPGIGAYPCAGIYAVGVLAGTIRQGDTLMLRD